MTHYLPVVTPQPALITLTHATVVTVLAPQRDILMERYQIHIMCITVYCKYSIIVSYGSYSLTVPNLQMQLDKGMYACMYRHLGALECIPCA